MAGELCFNVCQLENRFEENLTTNRFISRLHFNKLKIMQTCYKRRAKTAGRRRARRDKEAEPAPFSSVPSSHSHAEQSSSVVDAVDPVDPVDAVDPVDPVDPVVGVVGVVAGVVGVVGVVPGVVGVVGVVAGVVGVVGVVAGVVGVVE